MKHQGLTKAEAEAIRKIVSEKGWGVAKNDPIYGKKIQAMFAEQKKHQDNMK